MTHDAVPHEAVQAGWDPADGPPPFEHTPRPPIDAELGHTGIPPTDAAPMYDEAGRPLQP